MKKQDLILLNSIIIASLIVILLLFIFNSSVVYPEFKKMIILNTENFTDIIFKHIKTLKFYKQLKTKNIQKITKTKVFLEEIKVFAEDFNIEKIKIYDINGVVIYSTDKTEIGQKNDEIYFLKNIKLKHQSVSNIVEKGKETLENRMVSNDLIEHYIPISYAGKFAGVFELYLDISGILDKTDNIYTKSLMFSLLIIIVLFLIVLFLFFRIKKNQKKIEHQEKEIHDGLTAALEIQKKMLPRPDKIYEDINISYLFLPSVYVSGDIFNVYRIDDSNYAFYMVDVISHGFPAALSAVSISKYLQTTDPSNNIIKIKTSEPPYYAINSPKYVLENLNKQFYGYNDEEQYFTIIYGIIDISNNKIRMSRAGHPNPIIQLQTKLYTVKEGNPPLGISTTIKCDEFEFDFPEKSRIFIYSDGIIECPNQHKEMFGEKHLTDIIKNNTFTDVKIVKDIIHNQLENWSAKTEFEDDVTLLIIERK